MAIPTAVNGQITDSVTQSNVQVLGDAPSLAMGNLYQTTAQALGNAAQNATANQQNMNSIISAATTVSVNSLLGSDSKK